MNWTEFKSTVYQAAEQVVRRDSGELLGVEVKKIREDVFKVGDVAPLAPATATGEFQAASQLAAYALKKVQDEARQLNDDEFAARLDEIVAELADWISEWIEGQLSDADIAAWRQGETTSNVERLIEKIGAFDIWGSRNGREPLQVVWPA